MSNKEDNFLQEKLLEALELLKATNAVEVSKADRLKAAVCGIPKSGKSCLIARTCRKPLLDYDFDDRRESIAGIPDVHIKTLVDKSDDNPTAWGELESDLGTLEYLKGKGALPYRSIALDSITFLRKYAEHQFIKDASTTSKAVFKIGTAKYIIPRGWDSIVGVQKMLEGILTRFFALGVDVYATFHTRQEKDQTRSTPELAIYKDNLTIDPENLKVLLTKFNEVWRCYLDGNNFKMQMKPDSLFSAATALHINEETVDQNIQAILEEHEKNK